MRRWLKRLAWVLGPVLVVLVLVLIGLRIWLNGPALARFVTGLINPGIAGKVKARSIEWDTFDFLASPMDVPVVMHDVEVYDPHGNLTMAVPRATGRIELWPLMSPDGFVDVVVDDLDAQPLEGKKLYCLVEEQPSPWRPLPYTTFGLTSTFDGPGPPTGKLPPPGPLYDLDDAKLTGVELDLKWMRWRAVLYGMSTPHADLYASLREKPTKLDFVFTTTDRAPTTAERVTLTIPTQSETLAFELKDFVATKFGIFREDPSRMAFDFTATTAEGTRLAANGALTDIWRPVPQGGGGVELELSLEEAGPLLARLAHGAVGGAHAKVHAKILGHWVPGVAIDVDVTDLDVPLPAPGDGVASPGALAVRHATTRLDLAAGTIELSALDAEGLGGALTGTAKVDLAKASYEADVAVARALDAGPWLPAKVVRAVGGSTVQGTLRVVGGPTETIVTPKQLTLGRARVKEGSKVRVTGGVVSFDVFKVTLQGTEIDLSGTTYNIKTKKLDAKVGVDVDPLGPLLAAVEAPRVLQALLGQAKVTGSYDGKTGKADVKATGIDEIRSLVAKLVIQPPVVDITTLDATLLGGTLAAKGRVRLGPPLKLERLTVVGSRLELDGLARRAVKLGGTEPYVSGTLRLRLTADGTPPRRFTAAVEADVPDLALLGVPLGALKTRATIDEAGTTIDELGLVSPTGGTLVVKGRVGGLGDTLDLAARLDRLALARVPGVPPQLGLAGTISLDATIGGSVRRPEPTGALHLSDVTLAGALLGAADLSITPLPDGRARLAGSLFQDKLRLEAELDVAKKELRARLAFRRVELEEFLPDLAAVVGGHGWASGVAEVTMVKGRMAARLAVDDVQLTFDGDDELGRPRPVLVSSAAPLEVTWDGTTATLTRPASFKGPTGTFKLEGKASPKEMDLRLNGEVELSVLAFYTRRFLDESRGTAKVDLRVTGAATAPHLLGTLELANAAVRRVGQETWVTVEKGDIQLSPDAIEVKSLVVEVDDARTQIAGKLTLASFRPVTVVARVSGRIAARLVEVVFPRGVSGSRGSAGLDVNVSGTWEDPQFDGLLTFDSPFEVAPRGLRRDVALTSGQIRFTDKQVLVRDVRGAVDDSRDNLYISGNREECTPDGFCQVARHFGFTLNELFVRAELYGFSHRIPGVLDLEADMDVVLAGDRDLLQLRGTIDVLDGRFTQNFRLDQLLIPVRTTERSEPFYKDQPLLESMLLGLEVRTRSGAFRIESNVGEVPLSGEVRITGTPPTPWLEGKITADGGWIKIPFARPKFQLQSGLVTFENRQRVPEQTPDVDFSARADFEDLSGRQHQILLTIKGKIPSLKIDLSTNLGLNTGQTMQLILTRNSDLDDFARGRSQQSAQLTSDDTRFGQNTLASSDAFTSAADPVIKEAFSQYLTNLVQEPLRKVLRLDCFNVEAGLESTRFYACKDPFTNLRFDVDLELGLRGGSKLRGGGKLQLSDALSIGGDWQRITPIDEREEVRSRLRLPVLKLRIVIP